MTAIADTAPGQLIRWHYLGDARGRTGVMTVARASYDHWFLNFIHVIAGVLWTGIDLFMGFVIGPIRRKALPARRAIIFRPVPLDAVPDADTLDHHRNHRPGTRQRARPPRCCLAAVRLGRGGARPGGSVTVQGVGLLLPTNLLVCIELRLPIPTLPRSAG